MEFKHTNEELKYLQALPLDLKIAKTKLRIVEFYEHYNGNVAVSFSGGKDSTVLLHIARELYPEVKGVYCDTGLEFPEVKAHVKSFDNIDIIRPRMSFKQVIDEIGWVYPSKDTARTVYYAKKGSKWALNKFKGLNNDGTPSKFKQRYKKWAFLVDAPFKISDECCNIMKKKPFHEYKRALGGGIIVGTMAGESALRKNAWLQKGCNAFEDGQSKPMSFWTEQDVLQYIVDRNIKIPTVYGDIVKVDGKWTTTGEHRTGCMWCPIGCHLDKDENRFQRMARTHPKIYDYCMNQLGLAEFLDYIGVDYKPKEKQPTLFEGGDKP